MRFYKLVGKNVFEKTKFPDFKAFFQSIILQLPNFLTS